MQKGTPEIVGAEQPGVTLSGAESAFLTGYLGAQLGARLRTGGAAPDPLVRLLDRLELAMFGRTTTRECQALYHEACPARGWYGGDGESDEPDPGPGCACTCHVHTGE